MEVDRPDPIGEGSWGRRDIRLMSKFPKIICLCGSTRFKAKFNEVNLKLTLAGYIVLSVGSFTHSDTELNISEEQKVKLDYLHKRKIDLADAVVILNVGGYVGDSTRSEIEHARGLNKPAVWLEQAVGVEQNVVAEVDDLF
jgi:hypothetical protein